MNKSSSIRFRGSRASLAVVLASLLVLIGVGYVSAKDNSQVINACKSRWGFIRIIKSSQDCRRWETPIQWNVKGAPGDAGEQGPPGPPGEGAAPSGAVMFFYLDACPVGWSPFPLADGRVIVAMTSGGTLGGLVGNHLTDLEDRTSLGTTSTNGDHRHIVDPPNWFTSSPSSLLDIPLPLESSDGVFKNSGIHGHQINLPPIESFAGGSHAHEYESASTSEVIPYIQLLACVKD